MSQTNTIEPRLIRKPDYTIYKPNRKGQGGAISFSFNQQKEAVFVEAAPQKAEKKFDWDRKIIMKWGISDLGTILAGLQSQKPVTKLFHQTERASSACNLSCRIGEDGMTSFFLTISRQDAATKEVQKLSIPISDAEVSILEIAFKTAIGRILSW